MSNSQDLVPHITATYLTLRRGIAIIALVFPFVLWIGAYFWNGTGLQSSISAYYHTDMRNVFVGVLCAIGSFLYLYKGLTSKENIALNVAGLCAAGAAFFPTDPTVACNVERVLSSIGKLHGLFAAVFFAAIAYVCIVLSARGLSAGAGGEISDNYRRGYEACGSAMLLCVVLGVSSLLIPKEFKPVVCQYRAEFFVESIAVLAFSAYWILKSNEIDHAVSWLPWRTRVTGAGDR